MTSSHAAVSCNLPKPSVADFSARLERKMRKLSRTIALFAAAAGIFSAVAHGQSVFQPTPVGNATSAQTISVMLSASGTVTSVQALTQGTPGLDFAVTSSSCSGSNLDAGDSCSVAVAFAPTAPGLRPGAVVLSSGSTVLGVAYVHGMGLGGLGVMSPGTMVTAAGDGEWTSVYDGNQAGSADLDLPQDVAFDGAGEMYIADSAHNRVRIVAVPPGTQNIYTPCANTISAISCRTIQTLAGTDEQGYTGDGGVASGAELNTPTSVAVDGAGNLYIADSGNNVVREVIKVSGNIVTVAGNGTPGASGDGGAATSAELNGPVGVTVDANGNLFIADQKNQKIREVAVGTGIITTVVGNGQEGNNGDGTYSGDGGPATAAGLGKPFAVAFDVTGNMYIPDSGNNVVRVVNAAGTIQTFAGNYGMGYGFSGDGGAATSAQLYSPSGVVVDVSGDVIIADTQNNRIREVNPQNGTINTVAGNGTGKYASDDMSALVAGIYGPYGLAVDSNGDLFIADYFDHRIREIPSNMAILTYTPAIRVDQTSPTQNQVVVNQGNATLQLSSPTADENAKIDEGQTSCTANITLAVFANCTVGAQFAPIVAGNPTIGNITMDTQLGSGSLDIEEWGQALALNAATVALVSSANPSPYGAGINLIATVTTGANTGALSGYVTFLDGTAALGSPVAVSSSGTATFNTAALAVGTHSITASYGGDQVHTAAVSGPLLQNVDEATNTTVVVSANPAQLGASITLTALVSAKSGGVTPSGTVVFYDGATVIGSGVLNNQGVAMTNIATLASGDHSITASYAGISASFILGSTSTVLNLDIQAPSTTQLISSANPSVYGNMVLLTATVTEGANVPATSGTVQFLDGATPIGTGNVAGGGATLNINSLAAGTHSISAVFKASLNAASSSSQVITQVVNKTTTAVGINYNPDPAIGGKSVTLSAAVKVTTGAGTPTGSVSFADGATVLGTAALSGSGVATINANLVTGAHNIVATYTGDANDGGSASATTPLSVIPATTVTKLATSANPSTADNALTITANVSGNGGTPTGSVTFSADGNVLGTKPLDASGSASFSLSSLSVGTHAITVSYAGDVNDAGSISSSLSEQVNPIASTTTIGTATSTQSNQNVVLVATVMGASGPAPTGTVTFMSGSTVLGSAQVDGSGVATLTPDVNSGTMSVAAQYSGDSVHSPSSSSALSVTDGGVGFNVTTNPQSLTMASSQNATVSVTFQSTNGFADKIGLGCASLPSMMSCQFSSNSVTLNPNGSQTVQLTIDTNAPLNGGTQARLNKEESSTNGDDMAGMLFPASAGLGLLLWRGRRKYRALFAMVLAMVFGGALLGLNGCAGISMNSQQPGTYNLQITGTGVNSAVSRSINLRVQVTK